ncbi:TPA: ead/Ea22-like family protein [Klebsiella pneumoniae]
MTDITELAQRMKAAAGKATQGEWWADEVKNEGCYGSGDDCVEGFTSYAIYGSDGQTLFDSLNSDAACISEEYDGEGHVAWDETAQRNAEFIALANPANILALVEALEKAQQHENEWKSLCEAAAVDLDDWREIDDKSRDLLCKLADTVIAKAEQSAEWERKAISNFEDCAEMSARLEELESQRKLAFAASNRWADKFREAEKRITELESRAVTVGNLQESAYRAGLTAGWNLGLANNNDGFNKCLAAHTAGIKVEAE